MDKVLVIDFGSQVTKLITKKIRKIGVYSEIKSHTISLNEINELDYKCVILSGGPQSVLNSKSPSLGFDIQKLNIPVLGICYGMQLIVKTMKGELEVHQSKEYGSTDITIDKNSSLFKNITINNKYLNVWMSHGDSVCTLPTGFKVIAKSEKGVMAAVENKEKNIYGLQFHPEVEHTDQGNKIIENFVLTIAQCQTNWTTSEYIRDAQEYLTQKIKHGKVLCAVSGGVDSTVLATLINKTFPKQDLVKAIFVNHGLLRLNEEEEVREIFKKLNCELKVVHAEDFFLSKLSGIEDPEQKRKIIGKAFIEVFEKELQNETDSIKYLAQGTLYPDVIESTATTGESVTIKSHHNVGGLPEKLGFELVEPFRNFFKDEVRDIGRSIGVDEKFIQRHPFPGPGLAVRIIGDLTKEKCDTLREADVIFINMLKKEKLYSEIWQAFAVLLPIKTVGVQGDGRSYEDICALRAITSVDGMTADVYDFQMNFLKRVATKIVNDVKGINRVVFDISSKPPATIEWE